MTLSDLVLHVVPRLERDARLARAELRQLEQQTGQAANADGTYWLARTAAMEIIAEAAQRAHQTGDVTGLTEPLDLLRMIPAPACNPCDHQQTPA